ncbi:MAG TPA: FAD-binding oxidoreductase [Fimbriimonadaceae bacterium]|nr:FAD-binding oxidoreductase [Fimbriimonadaceae bacterium]
MKKPQLTGRIITPTDPGWEEARIGFARWADYDQNIPVKIVFCQDTCDVQNAVRYARENSIPFRVRAGRHNYEAFSSLVEGGVIIDVSEMQSVKADAASAVAEIGAGIYMLEMFDQLGEVGLTLPGATGPSVGLGGLVLGGGFGVTTRKLGLMCDLLTNVELVNADGDVVNANKDENPDLFWACRGGGGGNFGVATKFTFDCYRPSLVAIFTVEWPWESLETVVDTWQRWGPTSDNDVSTFLTLLPVDHVKMRAPSTPGTVQMHGQFTPDSPADLAKAQTLLMPLLAAAPPMGIQFKVVPEQIAARIFCSSDPQSPTWFVDPHSDNQIYKSTSAFVVEPFPKDAISALKMHLDAVPELSCTPSQPSMVQLLGGGGVPSKVKPTDTAVFYRDTQFVIQYDGYWTAPEDGAKTIKWVIDFRNDMSKYTKGAYVNYSDSSLKDPLRMYYGGNLERLVEVKAKYDPDNVFNFPQSIPTSL